MSCPQYPYFSSPRGRGRRGRYNKYGGAGGSRGSHQTGGGSGRPWGGTPQANGQFRGRYQPPQRPNWSSYRYHPQPPMFPHPPPFRLPPAFRDRAPLRGQYRNTPTTLTPPTPLPPLPGSEEYTQGKIRKVAAWLKRELSMGTKDDGHDDDDDTDDDDDDDDEFDEDDKRKAIKRCNHFFGVDLIEEQQTKDAREEASKETVAKIASDTSGDTSDESDTPKLAVAVADNTKPPPKSCTVTSVDNSVNFEEIRSRILAHISTLSKAKMQNVISGLSGYDEALHHIHKNERLAIFRAVRETIIPDCGVSLDELPLQMRQDINNLLKLNGEESYSDCEIDRVDPEVMFQQAQQMLDLPDDVVPMLEVHRDKETSSLQLSPLTKETERISSEMETLMEPFIDPTSNSYANDNIPSSSLDELTNNNNCNFSENDLLPIDFNFSNSYLNFINNKKTDAVASSSNEQMTKLPEFLQPKVTEPQTKIVWKSPGEKKFMSESNVHPSLYENVDTELDFSDIEEEKEDEERGREENGRCSTGAFQNKSTETKELPKRNASTDSSLRSTKRKKKKKKQECTIDTKKPDLNLFLQREAAYAEQCVAEEVTEKGSELVGKENENAFVSDQEKLEVLSVQIENDKNGKRRSSLRHKSPARKQSKVEERTRELLADAVPVERTKLLEKNITKGKNYSKDGHQKGLDVDLKTEKSQADSTIKLPKGIVEARTLHTSKAATRSEQQSKSDGYALRTRLKTTRKNAARLKRRKKGEDRNKKPAKEDLNNQQDSTSNKANPESEQMQSLDRSTVECASENTNKKEKKSEGHSETEKTVTQLSAVEILGNRINQKEKKNIGDTENDKSETQLSALEIPLGKTNRNDLQCNGDSQFSVVKIPVDISNQEEKESEGDSETDKALTQLSTVEIPVDKTSQNHSASDIDDKRFTVAEAPVKNSNQQELPVRENLLNQASKGDKRSVAIDRCVNKKQQKEKSDKGTNRVTTELKVIDIKHLEKEEKSVRNNLQRDGEVSKPYVDSNVVSSFPVLKKHTKCETKYEGDLETCKTQTELNAASGNKSEEANIADRKSSDVLDGAAKSQTQGLQSVEMEEPSISKSYKEECTSYKTKKKRGRKKLKQLNSSLSKITPKPSLCDEQKTNSTSEELATKQQPHIVPLTPRLKMKRSSSTEIEQPRVKRKRSTRGSTPNNMDTLLTVEQSTQIEKVSIVHRSAQITVETKNAACQVNNFYGGKEEEDRMRRKWVEELQKIDDSIQNLLLAKKDIYGKLLGSCCVLPSVTNELPQNTVYPDSVLKKHDRRKSLSPVEIPSATKEIPSIESEAIWREHNNRKNISSPKAPLHVTNLSDSEAVSKNEGMRMSISTEGSPPATTEEHCSKWENSKRRCENAEKQGPNVDSKVYQPCYVHLFRYTEEDFERMKSNPEYMKHEEMRRYAFSTPNQPDSGGSDSKIVPIASEAEDIEEDGVIPAISEVQFETMFQKLAGVVLVIKIIGSDLLAATDSGNIYCFCLKTGKLLHTIPASTMPITSICILTNKDKEQTLYVGSLDSILKLYNYPKKHLEKEVKMEEKIQCMESMWGYIFLGSDRGHLMRYNVQKGKTEYSEEISSVRQNVLDVKATMEGARKVVLVAVKQSPVCVRDAMSFLLLRNLMSDHVPSVYTLLLEKNLVYCATSKHDILVYNFQDGDLVHRLKLNTPTGVVSLQMLGRLLFAGCYNGNVYIFDTADRCYLGCLQGPGGLLLSMFIINDKVIVGTKQQHVKALKIPDEYLQR